MCDCQSNQMRGEKWSIWRVQRMNEGNRGSRTASFRLMSFGDDFICLEKRIYVTLIKPFNLIYRENTEVQIKKKLTSKNARVALASKSSSCLDGGCVSHGCSAPPRKRLKYPPSSCVQAYRSGICDLSTDSKSP